PVAGDVILQVDDVARLLAAEQTGVLAQSLEDVAVADVGRDQPDSALLGEAVEAEVRHLRDGDELDAEVVGEDGEDLVTVERGAVRVDGEHPIAVAVEGDVEIEVALKHCALEERKVGRAAAEVDVRSVRLGGDRGHDGAELLERLRSDLRVGAVRAVDRNAHAGEVAAEALRDVLEVA